MAPPARAHDQTRVVFPVQPSTSWPRILDERVLARSLGDNRYEIISAPYFVRGIAVGDVVRARIGQDHLPVFEQTEESGTHITIHLTMTWGRNCFEAMDEAAACWGAAHGVEASSSLMHCTLTLDVGPDAVFAEVYGQLVRGREAGLWEFEESSVTSDWQAATVKGAPRPIGAHGKNQVR